MLLTCDSANISVKSTIMKSDQTRLDIFTFSGSRLEELDLATTKREMDFTDGLQSVSFKGKGERSGTWP